MEHIGHRTAVESRPRHQNNFPASGRLPAPPQLTPAVNTCGTYGLSNSHDRQPAVMTLAEGLEWLRLDGPGKAALVTVTPPGTYMLSERRREMDFEPEERAVEKIAPQKGDEPELDLAG